MSIWVYEYMSIWDNEDMGIWEKISKISSGTFCVK